MPLILPGGGRSSFARSTALRMIAEGKLAWAADGESVEYANRRRGHFDASQVQGENIDWGGRASFGFVVLQMVPAKGSRTPARALARIEESAA